MSHPFDEIARDYARKLEELDGINRQLDPVEPLRAKKVQLEAELDAIRKQMPKSLKHPLAEGPEKLET